MKDNRLLVLGLPHEGRHHGVDEAAGDVLASFYVPAYVICLLFSMRYVEGTVSGGDKGKVTIIPDVDYGKGWVCCCLATGFGEDYLREMLRLEAF